MTSRYIIFGVTGLSFFLVAISSNSVAVAFPIIASDFHVSLITAGWVLSIYQLAAVACMPLGGKAGEIFGVKRVYLFSIAVFTIGSLISALSPDIAVLILGRFLQAIGGGMLLPLSIAIVNDAFPESRQRAIGFFTSIMPLGNIVGPNIGGWLVASFGWRSTFWLNIPLSLIVLFISLKLFKAEKGEGGRLDLLGTAYFTAALSTFLIGISSLGDVRDGASWVLTAALFMAAIIFMLAFLRREGAIKNPIIDMQLLTERPFMAANIFNLLLGTTTMGLMSFVPLFATSVYGMTTLQSGMILTPRAVGMLLATIVTSFYLPRWGYRGPMLAGTCIFAASITLLGLEPSGLDMLGVHFNGAFLVGLLLFFMGGGMGIVAPAANNACIELMPERIGMITGLRGMFRQGGGAISVAVTTLVLHSFQDISRGFMVVYLGLAIILILTTPIIFLMPKSPGDICWVKKPVPPEP